MITEYNKAVVTDAGLGMISAQIESGADITFTRFAIGNGTYTDAEKTKDALQGMTELKNEKNEYQIATKTKRDEQTVELKFVITNFDPETQESIVVSDYYANEIGLFAKVGSGEEQLFSITVCKNTHGDSINAYNGNNPIQILQTYQAVTDNAEQITVDFSGAYALAEDLESLANEFSSHEIESVTDTNGAHGVRYKNDRLEVNDNGTWKEAAGSGGSTLLLTTEEEIEGAQFSVSIGGASYPATIASGRAEIKGIKEVGTATITNVGGTSYTATVDMPYYGSYENEVFYGTPMEISISTTETTLYGKAATISYGGETKTVTIGSDGTTTKKIKYVSDGTMTITATDGVQTATTNVEIVSGTTTYSASLSFVQIYGVLWDGTSTTNWSRTDDAAGFTDPVPAVNSGNGSSPFDSKMPWAGMERVNDSSAGTLVKIPKFYYKWTRSGSTMKLQIADGYKDGFLVSPAHADRGDGSGERDVVYVGAYHCASSTYKSTTGVSPQVNITRSAARSSIHNLGSTIWQWDYAMLWTIQMLYLVEYANWNSQATIGGGCSQTSSTSSAVYTMGTTDSMTYHTGTVSSSHSAYGACRYRYIENLWGNCFDWCDGIYFSGSDVYCIKNPSNFSDTTGGTKVGTRATSSNYISKWSEPSATGFEYALYPTEVSGSESTYVCDYCYYSASGVVLYVGGHYSQIQNLGLFYLGGNSVASHSNAYIGSRLQKLP